ncbi:MAG TPA: DNA methyltransferase [Capsulimonadaceae bacterium]|nr:DNA methyltransferase [Capsulimonadaceae bacterium]
MAVLDQIVTDKYAIYNGDGIETMATLPNERVHLSVYSPPFPKKSGGMYRYSSSERDLSNADSYEQFLEWYGFVIEQVTRLTLPGRMTAVHCMDVPTGNTGLDALIDFPGDIIRLHQQRGWQYIARYCVWKEPLEVRNRTLLKNLAHRTIVDDSARCSNAGADFLLVFRNAGKNPVAIAHPNGFLSYAGSRQPPADRLRFCGYTGKQTENLYSHWVWRQYASCFWDDIRLERTLPYREARESEDEDHPHPLQLDVIERCLHLWSNPGETILSPFMGVGSEVYSAVQLSRKAIGIELKPSYFRQAAKNLSIAAEEFNDPNNGTFDFEDIAHPSNTREAV